VPTNFVAPTVTTGIADRINAISQEILSRTRLESIIKEFGLYPGGGKGTTTEDRVNALRSNIRLDIRRNDAFQISFDSDSPETAMKVANRVASLFIEQNLQVREQQAIGTTNFINAEAERLRKELEEQEALVTHYKVDNRFELPDQLDANLRIVEQLRDELKGNMATLASMQERLGSLQKQLLEANAPVPVSTKPGETEAKMNNLPANQKIQLRQKELDSLQRETSRRVAPARGDRRDPERAGSGKGKSQKIRQRLEDLGKPVEADHRRADRQLEIIDCRHSGIQRRSEKYDRRAPEAGREHALAKY